MASQKIPPTTAVIEAQTGSVLPPQRENRGVDMSGILVQLLGHFVQLHLHTVIGKQAMTAKPFRPGAGGNIVCVGLTVYNPVHIFFQRTGDKFRSIPYGLFLAVVLIFMALFGIREIPEDTHNQFLLFYRCRCMALGVIDLLHALTGGNILGIAAHRLTPGTGLHVLEFRY